MTRKGSVQSSFLLGGKKRPVPRDTLSRKHGLCPGFLSSSDDRDLEGPALPINTTQTRLRTWRRQGRGLSQITDSEHCTQDSETPPPGTTSLCPQVPPLAWVLVCGTCHCQPGPLPGPTELSDGLCGQAIPSPDRSSIPTYGSGSHTHHNTPNTTQPTHQTACQWEGKMTAGLEPLGTCGMHRSEQPSVRRSPNGSGVGGQTQP